MWLYRIIGEDQFILKLSDIKERKSLKISAIILLLNMMISMLSFTYLYATIFHFISFSIFLAIFSTLIIYNIYKLCLISIVTSSSKKSLGYIFSFLFRVLFIGFLGLLVAQGFLIVIYDLTMSSIDFKTASILNLVNKTLNESLLINVLEPLIIVLFLMPFFIKYFIKKECKLSEKTDSITNAIILNEYDTLKNEYTSIFKTKYNITVNCNSHYLDPPFNTIKQESPKETYGTNKDLRLHL